MARHKTTKLAALALFTVWAGIAVAQSTEAKDPQGQGKTEDLTELNLDDLANISVTTASKKAESLFGVGASLFVVTADDIKRSGAVNIPEALRLVPGVQVGQLNAQNYSVSVRGFNGRYSDKLLVLIDGRSIYNTLWGGVYWEDYNMSMEEIERIEVVRGPGGTLWGANAVNGIINIITKHAKDTQGGFLQVEGGNEVNLGAATLRYGGKMKDGTFRLTAYGVKKGQTLAGPTTDGGDNWDGVKGSFRFDGGTEKNKLSILADYRQFLYPQAGLLATEDGPEFASMNTPSFGGSFVAKFDNELSNGDTSSFQFFYDKTHRMTSVTGTARSTTLDFDYQYSPKSNGANTLVYGAGYRNVTDDYTSIEPILNNPKRTFGVFSGFIQNEQRLSKTSKFTAGAKVEHNEFSGWEVQPSIRYSSEHEKSAMWASVSRAVRTPNQVWENADVAFTGPSYETHVFGNPNLPSGSLIATEAGYRIKVNPKMTVDTSVFYNSYDHLDGAVQGAPYMTMSPYPHMVVPITFVDAGKAKTYGFEIASKMQVSSKWRVDLGYSFLQGDIPSGGTSLSSAKHQANLLSTFTLNDKLSFDQAVYFVGDQSSGIDTYTRVDLQMRYKASDGMELAFGGRNLGNSNYYQAAGTLGTSNLIQPQFYAKATWRF